MNPATQDSGTESEEMSYGQALYHAFWKAIFAAVAVPHMLLALYIVKVMSADPLNGAYGIAVLLAVPAAYFELVLFERAMKWERGPLFQFRNRAAVLLFVGYCLCLALAIGLTVHESRDRDAARDRAKQAEIDREKWRTIRDDPNTKRAMEFLEKRRAKEAKPQ